MTKSSLAKKTFVPGTSRGPRSVATLRAQVAKEREKPRDLERGLRIKNAREQRHLSQPAVVALLEQYAGAHVVGLRGYQEWEAGFGIRWDNARMLAAVLGLDVNYLMTGREAPDLVATLDGEQLRAWTIRIEAKIDALLDHAGITPQTKDDETLPPPPPSLRPSSKAPSRKSRDPGRPETPGSPQEGRRPRRA
jgi:transcriptional regulator with XRE-family HTH domain